MKWTYEKLKEREFVEVFIFENNESKRYKGKIAEQIKEDIPALNIKKGDFWIDVKKIKKRLIGKVKYMFLHKGEPLFYYCNDSEWVNVNDANVSNDVRETKSRTHFR